MNEQSGISFQITKPDGSPSPCKAQIIGVGETPSPKLGPVDRAHGCKDQFHSENGIFSIGLDPGTYRVILTRGIEHDHFEKEVEVKQGKFRAYNKPETDGFDTRLGKHGFSQPLDSQWR